MKIKANSWHYWIYSQVMNYMGNDNCISLCKYFWIVVAGCLKMLTIIVMIAIAVVVFCFGAYKIITLLFLHPFLLVAGGLIITAYGLFRWYRRSLTYKQPTAAKPPSILREYVRAKMDKVCPLVTFVYDNDSSPKEKL